MNWLDFILGFVVSAIGLLIYIDISDRWRLK